jgi:hypothetical protein
MNRDRAERARHDQQALAQPSQGHASSAFVLALLYDKTPTDATPRVNRG